MNIRSLTLDTPGGTLAALEAVPAGEPVGTGVLVPGYTGSKEDFAPLLPLLAAAGYRVLAYDQRGQYESQGPADPADYTVADFAGDLGVILAGLDRPHLLGHSFGGLVTRAAVLAAPASVRSLTLLDSLPGGEAGAGDEAAQMLAAVEDVLAAGGNEAFWQLFGGALEGQVPVEALEFLHQRMLRTNPANLIGISRVLRFEPDRTAELVATGVPLAVIYGVDDPVCPPALQLYMATVFGVEAVPIEGASHNPNSEQPEATAAAILEFWA